MQLRRIDASFKVDGVSLNDTLFSWLKTKFGYLSCICADLKQIYRQIWIHPKVRNYQRILWRFSTTEPVLALHPKVRNYQRLLWRFSTTEPFLARLTILQLVKEAKSSFPDVSKILFSNIYVDIISGAAYVNRALTLQKELVQCKAKDARFELRKWASNHSSLTSFLVLRVVLGGNSNSKCRIALDIF